jgi:hypothetical protein
VTITDAAMPLSAEPVIPGFTLDVKLVLDAAAALAREADTPQPEA